MIRSRVGVEIGRGKERPIVMDRSKGRQFCNVLVWFEADITMIPMATSAFRAFPPTSHALETCATWDQKAYFVHARVPPPEAEAAWLTGHGVDDPVAQIHPEVPDNTLSRFAIWHHILGSRGYQVKRANGEREWRKGSGSILCSMKGQSI